MATTIDQLKVGDQVKGGPYSYCKVIERDGKQYYEPFTWGDFIDGIPRPDDIWENLDFKNLPYQSLGEDAIRSWTQVALEKSYEYRYDCGMLTPEELDAARQQTRKGSSTVG